MGSHKPHSPAVYANSKLNYISDLTLVKEREFCNSKSIWRGQRDGSSSKVLIAQNQVHKAILWPVRQKAIQKCPLYENMAVFFGRWNIPSHRKGIPNGRRISRPAHLANMKYVDPI